MQVISRRTLGSVGLCHLRCISEIGIVTALYERDVSGYVELVGRPAIERVRESMTSRILSEIEIICKGSSSTRMVR